MTPEERNDSIWPRWTTDVYLSFRWGSFLRSRQVEADASEFIVMEMPNTRAQRQSTSTDLNSNDSSREEINKYSPLSLFLFKTNINSTTASSPHYATVRRASQLKASDPGNTHHYSLRRQQPSAKGSDRPHHHRHTLLNGISLVDGLSDDINKRHSFGNFYTTEQQLYDSIVSKMNPSPKASTGASQRPVEFALIRNVRRDHDELYQRSRPAIHNLPKSHRQIPASIFLNHHRQHQQQKQQFGSSHSAFRPVQPTIKGKRASSEGHSPSNEENPVSSRVVSPSTSSLTSSSSSSVSSSLSKSKAAHLTKQRRLSCELPTSKSSKSNTSSLTRSVCEQLSTSKINEFSRTMSEILCDQFSEINLDAIEQDSLQPSAMKKSHEEKLRNLLRSSQESFTVLKDYRSSRASFSVKRGDRVDVLKQAGRTCFLVRKQTNGQIGFLPRGLMTATAKTRVDTFLETHGYRETVIWSITFFSILVVNCSESFFYAPVFSLFCLFSSLLTFLALLDRFDLPFQPVLRTLYSISIMFADVWEDISLCMHWNGPLIFDNMQRRRKTQESSNKDKEYSTSSARYGQKWIDFEYSPWREILHSVTADVGSQIRCRPDGLVVWFALRVREVPGSIPGRALVHFFLLLSVETEGIRRFLLLKNDSFNALPPARV